MPTAIKVYCAGAVSASLMKLAPGFESETGLRLEFTFGAVGFLKTKILAGEPVDALILNRPALEQLERDGKLLLGTISDLGRVGVGIAVRRNTDLPDVSTAHALRESLLAARSISYGDPAMGDSSGIHFANVLERLGVAQQVAAKTVLAPAGLVVVELVRQGEVGLGATQASVISACDGVTLAGLLPPDLQHITTYSSAISAYAAPVAAAKLFVAYLDTPSARASFDEAGLRQ